MSTPLRRYGDLLAHHIAPQRRRYIALTVLLLSSIGLQVVNPQIMRRFVDAATSGQASSVLVVAALSFMVLVIMQQVLNVGATYLGENVAWTATNAGLLQTGMEEVLA